MPVMTEEAAVRREVVPMNILIVDDEQSFRETCATVSEQCGMKALAVATAEEALEVLEHSAIDILLTDLKLQQSSGVELLKHVHDLHPEVAVVVLTQYGTIESAVEVTRMGAAAARRILEDDAPAVILLEEAAITPEADGPLGIVSRLDAVVTSLAVYAPVVVIGTAKQRVELSALIDAGAADYVMRDGGCLPSALGLIRGRLLQAQRVADIAREPFEEVEEDFGEVLRHELNNPLTGILGNAELLLAELHRKNDGQLPRGGERHLETIAALAVRLRETVRRLSQEWETRQHPVH